MHFLSWRTPAILLFVGVTAGCSGSSGPASLVQPGCADADGLAFCLVSCNLGCTSTGCSITEIAQNQPIILNFNQDVDPNSVTTSSISFRTASGEEPVGGYLVQGSTVTFVPEIRVVGGTSFFGFKASETYALTLPAGPLQINALRSTAGDRLASSVLCSLTVSRGVIDLDGRPPSAQLISPQRLTNTPRDTSVVVEFSELIDVSAFQAADLSETPVVVQVRKTKDDGAGGRECNRQAQAFVVPGGWNAGSDPVRQVTVARFTPLAPFPSESCVEVVISDRVRDLSGKQAASTLYTFITQLEPGPEQTFVEDFASSLNLDLDRSSGSWSNGRATPGAIGGDGLHGDFEVTNGIETSVGVFEWNTDRFEIPRSQTLSGQTEVVTDGVFRFSNFVLPKSATLRFVGSKPPRIYVRGNALIEGVIDLSALDRPKFNGNVAEGQAGGKAAAFGGSGGKGGNRNQLGTGPDPAHNGGHGEDLRLLAGHAYAGRAVDTGGRGSVEWPASGLSDDVRSSILPFIGASLLTSAGGGGGGYIAAGGEGKVIKTLGDQATDKGTPAPGGVLYDPFPKPGGASSFEHFLLGGSGGGGAGSHAFGSLASAIQWKSGAGGGGGGGGIAFRLGRDLVMAEGSRLTVRGGAGGSSITSTTTARAAAPGGGGSGGSVVLQLGGRLDMRGVVDLRGGVGGVSTDLSFAMETRGGTGSDGYIRAEHPGSPTASELGSTLPPATAINVGSLNELGPVVGTVSRWRATGLVFPPSYVRYVVYATIGANPGTRVLFSDDENFRDPSDPTLPNRGLAIEGQAVRFLIQAADVGVGGVVDDIGSVRPWRRLVGPNSNELSLDADGRTGYRFLLLFDRAVADAVVTKVVLYYKN